MTTTVLHITLADRDALHADTAVRDAAFKWIKMCGAVRPHNVVAVRLVRDHDNKLTATWTRYQRDTSGSVVRDGDGFALTEDVGQPQPPEPPAILLGRFPEHVPAAG